MPGFAESSGAFDEPSSSQNKRKRSQKYKPAEQDAIGEAETLREQIAQLQADLKLALAKNDELARQVPKPSIARAAALPSSTRGLSAPRLPVPALPNPLASSALSGFETAVISLEKTIQELSTTVTALARTNCHRSIAQGALIGLPSWCARCVVKGGVWNDKLHHCVRQEGSKKCTHCANIKRPCTAIPEPLWAQARRFIGEIKHAQSVGGEALLATGVKGAMFAKKMRARKSRYKSVASHPYGPVEAKNNALVEEKLDRLIALVRINTQLAMHDHGLQMEDIDEVPFEDVDDVQSANEERESEEMSD